MAFKVGFIVRAPQGNPEKDITVLKTAAIEITTVVVEINDADQMVEICRKLVFEDGIQALVLCPAVTNDVVAGISNVISDKASLFVGRGDFQSVHLASKNTMNEWFSDKTNT